jgi:hypothetical protein
MPDRLLTYWLLAVIFAAAVFWPRRSNLGWLITLFFWAMKSIAVGSILIVAAAALAWGPAIVEKITLAGRLP